MAKTKPTSKASSGNAKKGPAKSVTKGMVNCTTMPMMGHMGHMGNMDNMGSMMKNMPPMMKGPKKTSKGKK